MHVCCQSSELPRWSGRLIGLLVIIRKSLRLCGVFSLLNLKWLKHGGRGNITLQRQWQATKGKQWSVPAEPWRRFHWKRKRSSHTRCWQRNTRIGGKRSKCRVISYIGGIQSATDEPFLLEWALSAFRDSGENCLTWHQTDFTVVIFLKRAQRQAAVIIAQPPPLLMHSRPRRCRRVNGEANG